jgi:hypothetical protein
MGLLDILKFLNEIGIGFLLISLFLSAVLFGLYYFSFDSYDSWNLVKNPHQYQSGMRESALAITVSSVFGILCCFISVAISVLLSLLIFTKNILFTLIGLGVGLFTAIVIGFEVRFYNLEVNRLKGKTDYNYNSTKVRKYIKGSLEELYNTAYDYLSTTYPDEEALASMPKFSQFQSDFLGQPISDDEPHHILQYADLLNNEYRNFFITFTLSEEVITAAYLDYDFPVATLQILGRETTKAKKQVCWIDEQELKCQEKEFEFPQTLVSTLDTPFSLHAYIVDGKYHSYYEVLMQNYEVQYEIEQFPFCYHLLTNGTEPEEPYQDCTNSYNKLDIQKYIEAFDSYIAKYHSDRAIICPNGTEPISYENLTSCTEVYVYDSDFIGNLPTSFLPNANVGKYPKLITNAASKYVHNEIFDHQDSTRLARYAYTLFIVQICAFVVWFACFVLDILNIGGGN